MKNPSATGHSKIISSEIHVVSEMRATGLGVVIWPQVALVVQLLLTTLLLVDFTFILRITVFHNNQCTDCYNCIE